MQGDSSGAVHRSGARNGVANPGVPEMCDVQRDGAEQHPMMQGKPGIRQQVLSLAVAMQKAGLCAHRVLLYCYCAEAGGCCRGCNFNWRTHSQEEVFLVLSQM